MPEFYTNEYDPDKSYGSAQLDDGSSHIALPGKMGGRLRYKVSTFTQTAAMTTNDAVRLFSVKSSDIPVRLLVTSPGSSGTETAQFGLYAQGKDSGVAIDKNCFTVSANVNLAGADMRADVLLTGDADLSNLGFSMWQWAAAGAATYTADPITTWDLCLSWVGDVAGTSLVCVELEYVAT